MADLKITGNMQVKTLKKQFKSAYDATLRVYNGAKFADDDATLASIRKGDAKGGEFEVHGRMLVGNFEKKMLSDFGIKVQVASKDDSKLVPDSISLSQIGKQ
jgi:hypothetical protein